MITRYYRAPVSCLLSGCAARHSFILLFIHQTVTKSWALGPLDGKKKKKNSIVPSSKKEQSAGKL